MATIGPSNDVVATDAAPSLEGPSAPARRHPLLDAIIKTIMYWLHSLTTLFSLGEFGKWEGHPEVQAHYTPQATAAYQDMTRPLPEYFISSGHNSYLVGNQLWSRSSTVPIRRALRRNCRVIELDSYNASRRGGPPLVLHGGTLTKPVHFEDCVRVLAQHAFDHSPYPIIVSLEDHTDAANQVKLVEILRRVLGPKLWVPTPEVICGGVWPSPEDLKYKVVLRTQSVAGVTTPEMAAITGAIKCKHGHYSDTFSSLTSPEFSEGRLPLVPEFRSAPAEGEAAAEHPLVNGTWVLASHAEKHVTIVQGSVNDSAYGGGGSGVHILEPTASDAAAQADGQGDSGSSSSDDDDDVPPMVTKGQKKHAKMISLVGALDFNCANLTRMYPAGWRVDSGNVDPAPAWAQGISVCALNWQVWDRALRLNEAKFSDNGGCGYVLKPEWMRPSKCLPSGCPAPARAPSVLRVTVLSAHAHVGAAISFWKPDVFVALEIAGVPCDAARRTTRVAVNSGRLMAEETFDFRVLYPEVAQLMLEMRDDDGVTSRLMGYYGMAVPSLREGRFKLPLRHPGGRYQFLTEWIKVEIQWLEKEGVPVQCPGLEGLGARTPSEPLPPLDAVSKAAAPPACALGAVPSPSPTPVAA